MANDDHALLALLQVRAQAVEKASLAVLAAEKRVEVRDSSADSALEALENARVERARVLDEDSASTRPLRVVDLAARHAWLGAVDAGISKLERDHEERVREAEAARFELDACRRALVTARADELALARRVEDLSRMAGRARERIEEDDALEAHGARTRLGAGAKSS